MTPEQEHGPKGFPFSHIKVVFLPLNVIPKSQPCDQGIIACYKVHYRRFLVQWLLDQANSQATMSFS
jgi:hypothetical protein